jgi:hypothetical protein
MQQASWHAIQKLMLFGGEFCFSLAFPHFNGENNNWHVIRFGEKKEKRMLIFPLLM